MPRKQNESDKRRSAAERVSTAYNMIGKLRTSHPELFVGHTATLLEIAEDYLGRAANAAERWAKEKP